MNIQSKLKSTFHKALNQLNTLPEYKDKPESIKRSFAGCVAIFCHDDVEIPLNKRMAYLSNLIKLTGGPTLREHYCNWKAMSIGDGLRNAEDGSMTSFFLDPRFPRVGTWKYDFSFNFCLEHIFAPISKEHYIISLQEPYFDDPLEDLEALARFAH